MTTAHKPAILVIDDEIQIRRLLKVVLESAGYHVYEADCGQLGLSEVAHRHPDAVILDLGLPDIGGIEVLKHLREWSTVPVLILSVREMPEEKVAALDLGADDYVTKPFESGELLARLRALQRRSQTGEESPTTIIGSLSVDLANHQVWVNKKEVKLTPTEFSLLRILIKNTGKIVTQKQILREVWGPKSEEQSQYTRVYMTHLRKKLSAAGFPADHIRTESGIGYRLINIHE